MKTIYGIFSFLGWRVTDERFKTKADARRWIYAMGWQNEALQIRPTVTYYKEPTNA